jgi:hypothetical protein
MVLAFPVVWGEKLGMVIQQSAGLTLVSKHMVRHTTYKRQTNLKKYSELS